MLVWFDIVKYLLDMVMAKNGSPMVSLDKPSINYKRSLDKLLARSLYKLSTRGLLARSL